MTHDRTEAASLAVSMSIHIIIVILLSAAVIKAPPKRVALITDVTLIDVKDYRGEKGEEKKSVGVAKKQKKTATVIKKKEVKTVEKKTEIVDIKKKLAELEKKKAQLSMGITRDNLMTMSREKEEIKQEVVEEEIIEEEVVAGGEPTISGDLATRKYKKVDWRFPKQLPEETELMIEITVLSSGIIKNVRLLRTSGYPELDRLALSQARKLQFDPLPFKNEDQAGVLLFKFGAEK